MDRARSVPIATGSHDRQAITHRAAGRFLVANRLELVRIGMQMRHKPVTVPPGPAFRAREPVVKTAS